MRAILVSTFVLGLATGGYTLLQSALNILTMVG